MKSLSKSKPKCVASLMWLAETKDDIVPAASTSTVTMPVAMYIDDYIIGKTLSLPGTTQDKVDFMKNNMPAITDSEIKLIATITSQQSDDEKWKRARLGRITASNFGKVQSRATTLQDPNSTLSKDPGPLLIDLMCYKPPPADLKNFVYGHKQEVQARMPYLQYQIAHGHVNIKIDLTGLHISKEYVYLGASPDLLVQCDCCGHGMAEIKCPITLKDATSICDSRPKFLRANGKELHLNSTHYYFAQIQGQMAICGKKWCDFVVFCPNDLFVERIQFDLKYWEILLSKLIYFYSNFMLHEIITYSHRPEDQTHAIKAHYKRSTYLARKAAQQAHNTEDADIAIQSVGCNVTVDQEGLELLEQCAMDMSSCTLSNDLQDLQDQDRSCADHVSVETSRTDHAETYYCPVCKQPCEDGVRNFKQQSILCEKCEQWLHMKCANLTKKKLEAMSELPFTCKLCTLSKK